MGRSHGASTRRVYLSRINEQVVSRAVTFLDLQVEASFTNDEPVHWVPQSLNYGINNDTSKEN